MGKLQENSDGYRVISLFMLIGLFFLLGSCGITEVTKPLIGDEAEEAFPASMPEYLIQEGDQLDIKFFYNSELNERVTVRPDGRISLQLVNDLVAAGLAPAELTVVLKEKYAAHLAQPELAVIVKTFDAFKVFIDGEVNKPGQIKLSAKMTVMQSISIAGGVRRSALLKDVMVIRRSGNKPLVLKVNLNNVIKGEVGEDIILQPFDVVYVPRAPIDYIGQWVKDYIRNIVPYSFSFGYSF